MTKANENTFLMSSSIAAQVDLLSDEEAGQLFKSVFQYAINGKETSLVNKAVLKSFYAIKYLIDREKERVEDISMKRTEAIKKRWERHKDKEREAAIPTQTDSGLSRAHAISIPSNLTNINILKKEIEKKEPPKGGKKEKNEKEKSEASAAQILEARKEKFYNSLVPYVSRYGKELVRAFFDYWTEPNKSRSKMRFELERTWDISRRLGTWASKDNTFIRENNGADRKHNSTPQSRAEDASAIIARLAAEDDARK